MNVNGRDNYRCWNEKKRRKIEKRLASLIVEQERLFSAESRDAMNNIQSHQQKP